MNKLQLLNKLKDLKENKFSIIFVYNNIQSKNNCLNYLGFEHFGWKINEIIGNFDHINFYPLTHIIHYILYHRLLNYKIISEREFKDQQLIKDIIE